jgi:hypothetical protein
MCAKVGGLTCSSVRGDGSIDLTKIGLHNLRGFQQPFAAGESATHLREPHKLSAAQHERKVLAAELDRRDIGFGIVLDQRYLARYLGTQFIEKIKSRVFNLNLVRYAVENMSKKVPPYFFPLFTSNEQGSKLSTFPVLDAKRY